MKEKKICITEVFKCSIEELAFQILPVFASLVLAGNAVAESLIVSGGGCS